MEKEKSLFLIKPEGVPYKNEIMGFIEKAGIGIKEWRILKLEEKDLRKLYPNIEGEIWEKTKDHLLNKEVIAVQVEAENAIEKLKNICGEKTDPVACDFGTVRRSFQDVSERDTFKYYKNIVHRAVDKKEAEEQILLFFPPERDF